MKPKMEESEMEENVQWYTKNWKIGELNALVKILGEDVARRILRGEVSVILEEAIRMFFDKNGRRIPKGLRANVCDANRDCYLDQPRMETEDDYAKRLSCLHNNLGIDTGINAEQFKQEVERQLALIRSNPQTANILNGVWLPVILPNLEADDLGMVLEQYLEVAKRSYVRTFSNRKFNNYRKGELVGQVSTVNGSRYDKLIERMRRGPIIGIYFPNPLQGFSIEASREQMDVLPDDLALSGLDIIIAMVMYPDVLARDWHTPGLDLAALSWRSAGSSLYLKAFDGYADFVNGGGLAHAYVYYSAGLVFFG